MPIIDAFVQVQPDSTGKKIDNSELVVGANTVERQRVSSADPSDPLGLAAVKNAAPGSTDYGVVTRNVPSGTQTIDLPALSSLQAMQVTVGTTAVRLDPTPLTNRRTISIKALKANSGQVYVGASNAVTTPSGYELAPQESVDLELSATQAVWGIGSAAGQGVAVLEVA